MGLDLEFPQKVLEELRRRAEREGSGVECIVIDAVMACLGFSDSGIKAEAYSKLSEKCLGEAAKLLAEGDYVQASEKAWGAAAQAIKDDLPKRFNGSFEHPIVMPFADG